MGDPKFSRRKYDTPSQPWQGDRIKEENEILKKYGLKNKRELWKIQSLIRNYRRQARDLLARSRYGDVQAEKEIEGLLEKLARLGVLPDNATLDDVLALDIERILKRRLQTLVYLKGLAYTPKQARQLIVHGHAVVNSRKVTVPGYLVKRTEEPTIAYNPYSPLANDLHPARPTAEHVERVAREFVKPKVEEKEEEKGRRGIRRGEGDRLEEKEKHTKEEEAEKPAKEEKSEKEEQPKESKEGGGA